MTTEHEARTLLAETDRKLKRNEDEREVFLQLKRAYESWLALHPQISLPEPQEAR